MKAVSGLQVTVSAPGEVCGWPVELTGTVPVPGHPGLRVATVDIGHCGEPAARALLLGGQRLTVCEIHVGAALRIARKAMNRG
jgi:hypothetical protein